MSYSYKSTNSSSVSNKFARGKAGARRTNNNRSRGGNKGGSYINPDKFIAKATIQEVAEFVPMHTFADFDLNELLHKNLEAKGYKMPSPIQDQAIPVGLKGQDIIGLAGTGTGKTAAFALPVIEKLMNDSKSSTLIVAPTRELAQQIEEEFRALAKGSGLMGVLLIGGTGMGLQLRGLRANPRIVIGTPGRIKDHIERRTLNLQNFNLIVLDEVDRMLDMGFVDDVREILSKASNDRQSFFFSATMNTRVRTLIETFTQDPVTIKIESSSASESVHQDVVRYEANWDKLDKLHDLLLKDEVEKVIIFDETQRSVERLNNDLMARGFSSDSIHGGRTQGQRQRTLANFKKDTVKILVATDVAARGIDVADVTHVINYSLPREYTDYIHRIGRAGRAGKVGQAYTFINK